MTPIEKRLLVLLSELDERDVETLLAFAEFLTARAGEHPSGTAAAATSAAGDHASQAVSQSGTPAGPDASSVPEPEAIPRPDDESVVGAIRRLSRSYHMVDTKKLFDRASTLMSQHVMEGRDAQEVIDELEELFDNEYRRWFGLDDER